MKKSKRPIWIGLIALGVIILITLIAAPSNNKIYAGSSYNRAPAGYGAWYTFMQQQGVNILRWQKPFNDLSQIFKDEKSTITLLQVNGNLQPPILSPQKEEWIKTGNTLIILGVYQPVANTKFTSMLQSEFGNVKIETRRRHELKKNEVSSLEDSFGAVVWQKKLG
ncbi:MAG: DUF4350 domain-containing protein, partial [Cyanobacteria bacterium P01_D01_bin.50]